MLPGGKDIIFGLTSEMIDNVPHLEIPSQSVAHFSYFQQGHARYISMAQ